MAKHNHQPYKIDLVVNNPMFFADTKERAQTDGVGVAVADTLDDANIYVDIDGKTAPWEQPEQPALFVGDHTSGIEDLLLLATLARSGREDVHFTAKPHSNLNHILAMLGQPEEDHMIPFIPRTLAKGREGGSMMDKLSRRMFADELLTEEQIRELNAASLQFCADALSRGRGINIFPTGTINKKGDAPWQRGVGEIIKLTPQAVQEELLIVPYKFEGVKPLHVLGAIAARSLGMRSPKQEIQLRIGRQEMAQAIFAEGGVDQLSGKEVTSILEQRFKADLLQEVAA